MVALHIRQEADDPLAAPSGDGISGALTVGAPDPTDTVFGVDTDVPMVSDSYTIPLVAGTPDIHVPTPTPSSSADPTPAPSASTESNAASDTGSASIPIGTTVGICVGALGGALCVVLFGLWLYKRATPDSRRGGTHRSSPHDRAPSQNWKKLDESGGDKWEGMQQMNEAPRSSDGADLNLNMFKKSASQRTAYTSKTATTERTTFDSEPVAFAQYHPALAEQMASSEDVSTPSLHPAPFARQNAPESWVSSADSQVTTASFLSLRPTHVEGSMSPSVGMAIPTPSISSGEVPHRWQSAQVVVDYGEHTPQSAEFVDNPFADRPASPNYKRGSEADPVLEHDYNPFSDDNTMPKASHMSAGSMASVTSNDRAIQSLIAALHEPSNDERARVESMQPSIMSQYTDDEGLSTPRSPFQFDRS